VGVLVSVGVKVGAGVEVEVEVEVGVPVGLSVIRKVPEFSAIPKIAARHAQISRVLMMTMQATVRHLPELGRAGGNGTGCNGAGIRAASFIGNGAPQRAQNLAFGLFSNPHWAHRTGGKESAGLFDAIHAPPPNW
jgi:hypothetical protein